MNWQLSLASTEQNRIFAIIICIKYPLSADISQGSDVYKCQVNDTFITIDAVCLLYSGAVQLLSFPPDQIRMNVRDEESEGPSSLTWAWYLWFIISILLTSNICLLFSLYLCHLGILGFPSSSSKRQTSCQNTKFCYTFCWFRTERTGR